MIGPSISGELRLVMRGTMVRLLSAKTRPSPPSWIRHRNPSGRDHVAHLDVEYFRDREQRLHRRVGAAGLEPAPLTHVETRARGRLGLRESSLDPKMRDLSPYSRKEQRQRRALARPSSVARGFPRHAREPAPSVAAKNGHM